MAKRKTNPTKTKNAVYKRVKIDTLLANPVNSRIHDDRDLPTLCASLSEFGQTESLCIQKSTNLVIGGNGRLQAMKSLGWTECDVAVVDVDDKQAALLGVALNRTAEMSSWDKANVQKLLEGVEVDNEDLQAMFDELADQLSLWDKEQDSGGDGFDATPSPMGEAKCKRGEVWCLGDHRLMIGDSGSPEDLDKLLGGEVIHLVNTDPPYNVKVEPRSNNAIAAGNSSFEAPKKRTHHQSFDVARQGERPATHKKLRAKDRPLMNDFVSDEAFDEMLEAWFSNMARVLQPGRGFYIWGGYANIANYPGPLRRHGMYFSQAVIWHKMHPVLTRKDFMGDHEWCFYGWREGAAHQWFGPKNQPDVWRIQINPRGQQSINGEHGFIIEAGDRKYEVRPMDEVQKISSILPIVKVGDNGIDVSIHHTPTDLWSVKKVNPQSMVHLTEKPVELAVRAMQLSSKAGENVLDLFGGSGSTMVAADRCKRRAFLMELDPCYGDVIIRRAEEMGLEVKRGK